MTEERNLSKEVTVIYKQQCVCRRVSRQGNLSKEEIIIYMYRMLLYLYFYDYAAYILPLLQ